MKKYEDEYIENIHAASAESAKQYKLSTMKVS